MADEGPAAIRLVMKWAAVATAVLATSATFFVISLGSGGSNGRPSRIPAQVATTPATGARLGPGHAGSNRARLGPDNGSRHDWDSDD